MQIPYKSITALLVAGAVLIGCSAVNPGGGTSGLNSPLRSPLSPTAIVATPAPTVTTDPTQATITGIIQVRTNAGVVPLRRVNIYLGDVVTDGQGQKTGVTYDQVNSPRSVTDQEGRFIFRNVPPKEYGLILDLVQQAYMLRDPKKDGDFIFAVTAGETKDLGTLVYDQLPLTPTP